MWWTFYVIAVIRSPLQVRFATTSASFRIGKKEKRSFVKNGHFLAVSQNDLIEFGGLPVRPYVRPFIRLSPFLFFSMFSIITGLIILKVHKMMLESSWFSISAHESWKIVNMPRGILLAPSLSLGRLFWNFTWYKTMVRTIFSTSNFSISRHVT